MNNIHINCLKPHLYTLKQHTLTTLLREKSHLQLCKINICTNIPYYDNHAKHVPTDIGLMTLEFSYSNSNIGPKALEFSYSNFK